MIGIKFRGLRIFGKGWVYGDLKKVSDYRRGGAWYYIYVDGKDIDEEGEEVRVYPYSVGQLTGLKDKNGMDIYEGDQFAPDADNDEVKAVVRWDEIFAKFVVDSYGYNFHIGEGSHEVYDNEMSICDTTDLGDILTEYLEIIGNIHEKGETK